MAPRKYRVGFGTQDLLVLEKHFNHFGYHLIGIVAKSLTSKKQKKHFIR